MALLSEKSPRIRVRLACSTPSFEGDLAIAFTFQPSLSKAIFTTHLLFCPVAPNAGNTTSSDDIVASEIVDALSSRLLHVVAQGVGG